MSPATAASARSGSSLRLLAVLLTLFAGGACDSAPVPGSGSLTVTVVSPYGAEGAAVVDLQGPGIRGVAADDGWVFARPDGSGVTPVVVVADSAGLLRFRVEVDDTLRRPEPRLVQVAGPDDRLRDSLELYRVEVGG